MRKVSLAIWQPTKTLHLYMLVFSFGILSLLSACSLTRNIPNGHYLLSDVQISSTDPSRPLPEKITEHLRMHPNTRVFGFIPIPLYIYNWSKPGANRWIDRQVRRMGEEPILYDSTDTNHTALALSRALENEGYLGSSCQIVIDTVGSQKVRIHYRLSLGKGYYIDSLSSNIIDPTIRSILMRQSPQTLDYPAVGRLLVPSLLDEARRKMVAILADNGYWNFSPEQIRYEADTTRGYQSVALRLLIEDSISVPYRLGSVSIWENMPVNAVNKITLEEIIKGRGQSSLRFMWTGKSPFSVSPLTLSRNIFVRPGDLYNTRAIDRTYAALVALPALRNTAIRFAPDSTIQYDSTGQPYRSLHADIITMVDKPKQISAELVGTNSAGDLGVAATVGILHRNVFGGSELLGIKLRGGYEAIRRGQYSFLEYGLETSLRFPRIVFPFLSEQIRKRYKASTELSLAYNYQTRPEFSRRILSGRWAYNIRPYGAHTARHRLKLIDIDYLHLPFIDETFRQSLPPSAELYNYTDQFIVGSGYSYTLTNNNDITQRRDAYLLRFSIEMAGNLLQGISAVTGANKDKYGSYNLFGINYAQFVKLDAELSRSFLLSPRTSVALRFALGAAYPYGNAERIPFELRYFGGGANGVRGWSIRSLGPGAMPQRPDLTIFDRVGDLSLIANAEYRASIFWRFELAAYVDAGNIWTLRNYDSQPEGMFRLDSFYREIAVSYGLGLRANFDYFVIRLDTGLKAYDPQQPLSSRLRLGSGNLSDRFAWHFAIGYPF